MPSQSRGTFNCQGISRKHTLLQHLVQNSKIGAIGLQETKLTNRKNFALKNFSVYRKDRANNTPHHGVILLVHEELPATEHQFPTDLQDLAVVAADIRTPEGIVTIVNV